MSKQHTIFRKLLLTALVLVVSACGGGGHDGPSAGAWGPEGTPLPDGFQMIDADAYLAARDSGRLRQVTPAQLQADQATEDAQAEKDLADIQAYVASVASDPTAPPDLAEKLLGVPETVPGELEPTGDGNYRLLLDLPAGNIGSRITLGPRARNRRLAEAIRRYQSRDNKLGLMHQLYAVLPAETRSQTIARLGFLPEETLDQATAEELDRQIGLIVADQAAIVPFFLPTQPADILPPAEKPATCEEEYGYPTLAPHSSELIKSQLNPDICGGFDTGGIYANLYWPLKYDATCVKDQGKRGTCTVFAIAGAVELMAAKNLKKWANLSEQALYFEVKGRWWPSVYGDGAITHDVWQKMEQTGFRIPLESYWPYNGAPGRIEDKIAHNYLYSCNAPNLSPNWHYADYTTPGTQLYCSDTVHQGFAACATLKGKLYCGYSSPMEPQTGGLGGYRARDEWEIWQQAHPEEAAPIAEIVLANGFPVVLSFDIPANFREVKSGGSQYKSGPKGLVGYYLKKQKIDGGHAMLLTGYISNEQLAEYLPDFPAGSGGGYFIAKNSWSTCFGDAGYAYLPVDWVVRYGWSMTVLSGLTGVQ